VKAYKEFLNEKCQMPKVGKIYSFSGPTKMIPFKYFSFHKNLKDIFSFYREERERLIIFEVEILGKTFKQKGKLVTDKINVIRILDKSEYSEFLSDPTEKYDQNGNLIYRKDSNGYENWWEFDKNNNLIHSKYSNGFEYWKEYDKNGNLIHYKDSNGYEEWHEYDQNNNVIHFKDSNGYEYRKEFDKNGNIIYYKDSGGVEEWCKYNDDNELLHYKDKDVEWSITIE